MGNQGNGPFNRFLQNMKEQWVEMRLAEVPEDMDDLSLQTLSGTGWQSRDSNSRFCMFAIQWEQRIHGTVTMGLKVYDEQHGTDPLNPTVTMDVAMINGHLHSFLQMNNYEVARFSVASMKQSW
jgi:hypothetical protein